MGFSAPYLIVYNQCDKLSDLSAIPHDGVAVSAKYGIGLEALRAKIFEMLQEHFVRCRLAVPYALFSEYNEVRPYITECSTEYTDDGMQIRAIVPTIYLQKVLKFKSE